MPSVIVSPFSTSGEGGSFIIRRSLMLMAPDAAAHAAAAAALLLAGTRRGLLQAVERLEPVGGVARGPDRAEVVEALGRPGVLASRERQIPDMTSFSGPSTPGTIDCSSPHSSCTRSTPSCPRRT